MPTFSAAGISLFCTAQLQVHLVIALQENDPLVDQYARRRKQSKLHDPRRKILAGTGIETIGLATLIWLPK